MCYKQNVLLIVRVLFLFCIGLFVSIFVALSQLNLESLRGNLLAVLRNATNMPIEIDGDISWRVSLRPQVSVKNIRIPNAAWAKNSNLFYAERIDVRLNLISLFENRPTIQRISVYGATLNLEENQKGEYSVVYLNDDKKTDDEKNVNTAENTVQTKIDKSEYPFQDIGIGGITVHDLRVNFSNKKYDVPCFQIRYSPFSKNREYNGWVKMSQDVIPFVISFSKYNSERKIYPVQIAVSTGGDALIANIALEGTSKIPIDFKITGSVPEKDFLYDLFGIDLSGLPAIKLNIAGGVGQKKLTLHKSTVSLRGNDFVLSGDVDWGKKNTAINLNVSAVNVNLKQIAPELFGGEENVSGRELNVFHDMPLFGDFIYGNNVALKLNIKKFVVYRDLALQNLNVQASVKNDVLRIDANTGFANGKMVIGLDGTIKPDGMIYAQMAGTGSGVQLGTILKQVRTDNFISDLPLNLDVYVRANGKDLSQMMHTITGPVTMYSTDSGYAHSELVSYMYGTDFLTSLRHGIQDMFSSKKKSNQMKISGAVVNLKLRNGVAETENGVAVETAALNLRLAGNIDLGREKIDMVLTTVPVRGLKISLSGNVVNNITIRGNLAEPDLGISGAALAGRALSATGLGLLLAPLTGGLGLVAGAGVGLIAGDFLENWLADSNPCKTALLDGAPARRNDPVWLNEPIKNLMGEVLKNR